MKDKLDEYLYNQLHWYLYNQWHWQLDRQLDGQLDWQLEPCLETHQGFVRTTMMPQGEAFQI